MARLDLVAMASKIERDLTAIRQILRKPVEAAIASGGLTGPQQSAMHALVTSGGMTLKELSKELGLAHSTVSGIVDRLQKQGLVERRAVEGDRRFTQLVVTGRVRDYMRDSWPHLEARPLAKALGAATPAERRSISEGVRALCQLLEREGEQ
jgi:DNA-binding MarR family transcriptional regulator